MAVFYALLFKILSLMVLVTSQTSFNFTDFRENWRDGEKGCPEDKKWVCLYKDAVIDGENGEIILTPNSTIKKATSQGRATYSQPVQLFNTSTNEIANFTTEFSFAIEDLNSSDPSSADGLVFFMSPFPFKALTESTGGHFGLVPDKPESNESRKFVAVELDTYYNRFWDPSNFHLGIDVNTVQSIVYQNLSEILQNSTGKVIIDYNANSSNLSVTLFLASNPPVHISSLVDFKVNLSEKVTVGFIGATYNQIQSHKVRSWSFSSTLELGPPVPDGGKGKKLIVGLVVGLGVLASLVGFLIWFFVIKRRKEDGDGDDDGITDMDLDGEFEHGRGPKRFSYKQLVSATHNFDKAKKLGEGGFGPVYKGYLRDLKQNVAIKRISGRSRQGRKEYIAEVKIFSQLRHKNLVSLIGWCHKTSELLLVYELMDNGDLHSHMFIHHRPLSWSVRYKIVQGLAAALVYLHEGWKQCVVHRDIKSSNVMLDKEFNAKLGDFGLARLSEHGSNLQTTMMAGTMGYMAPESFIGKGRIGKEADVYSFGIVALELACGRKCVDPNVDEDKVKLVEWVWEMYGEGTLHEVFDQRLMEEEEEEKGVKIDKEEIKRVMVLGLWCAHPDLLQRPTVSQSLAVLNQNAALPELPPKMPIPSFIPSISVESDTSYRLSSTTTSTSMHNAR
ncbi:putative Kinase [Zostera marina]|uniref:non-specific serine/threonine protein kinase n=1 Tax=Zostera marina TaxID=29655 RepID=A0A0K9NTV0_ZOSMR|nr:putative Kinase [Zostera marina]